MPNLQKRKKGPSTHLESSFKKAKKKVNTKKVASSHVNLSFSQKSINMPSQSIALEVKGDFTTHRNQTLKDLLPQSKHYNASVRKESLLGMKELFENHPQLVGLHLSTVLEHTIRMMADEEKSVRFALHSLYSVILDQLDEMTASTFSPLFVVYISSGMTHLTQSVRLDSLAFLNLWIDRFPNVIVKFAQELLPNFITLLQTKSITGDSVNIPLGNSVIGSSSVKKSALQSKVHILESLYKLLITLLNNKDEKHSWKEAVEFSWDHFQGQTILVHQWKNESTVNLDQDLIFDSTHFSGTQPDNLVRVIETLNITQNVSSFSFLSGFLKKMWNILLECWVEVAPQMKVLSTSDFENKSVEVMELILNILRLILINFQLNPNDNLDVLENHLESLLLRYFSYFPFSTVKEDKRTDEQILNLNRLMISIMIPFIRIFKAEKDKEDWPYTVCNHLIYILKKGVLKSFNLFDAIDKLLYSEQLSEDIKEELLESFINFSSKCHFQSSIKKECNQFIFEKLLVDQWIFKLKQWISTLPKMLWQLQCSNPSSTSQILSICAFIGRRFKEFESLQRPLIPFFFSTVKSKEENSEDRNIFGPFIFLSKPIQKKAVELLFYYREFTPLLLKAISITTPYLDVDIVTFMLEVVFSKRDEFALEDLISFFITVLALNSTRPKETKSNVPKIVEWEPQQRGLQIIGFMTSLLLSLDINSSDLFKDALSLMLDHPSPSLRSNCSIFVSKLTKQDPTEV